MTSTAFVLINCEFACEEDVIEELKKIQSVKNIQGVFGIYDIITKIESNDTIGIKEIVSSQIRIIKNVNSTLTLMVS